MSAGQFVAAVEKPAEAAPRVRWGWIVGPGVDLPWFLGGCLAAYALFALHAANQTRDVADRLDLSLVWVGWFALSNVPHFFGTYVRLYLDREERRQRARLAWGSLAMALAGPAVILGCFALYRAGEPFRAWHQLPFVVFAVIAGLWAYWHMVRQHYGFLALYKRKNQDVAAVDRWLDRSLLYVALLGPFVAFVLRNPSTRSRLAELRVPGELGRWESGLVLLIQLTLLTLCVLFVARQAQRWQRGEAVNGPKLLLFLALVPLYSLVGFHPVTLAAEMLAFSAFVTVFHDVQYHAIVYNHQRNRCHRAGTDRSRFGLAAQVTRSPYLYLGCAAAMGASAWLLSCRLDVYAGCTPLLRSATYPLFGELTLRDLFLGFALSFAMHHYFVDQFIWRPSKSAELRRDLRLEAPTT
jgi:hypothetical protein